MKGGDEKTIRLQVTILINLLSVLVELNNLLHKNNGETFSNLLQTE